VFWIQLLCRRTGVGVLARRGILGQRQHGRFGFTLHLIIDDLNFPGMHSSGPEIADHPDGASDPGGVI
jgi:hypothetical protein